MKDWTEVDVRLGLKHFWLFLLSSWAKFDQSFFDQSILPQTEHWSRRKVWVDNSWQRFISILKFCSRNFRNNSERSKKMNFRELRS